MEGLAPTGDGATPASPRESLASLVVRSSQGDEAAFAAVYDETASRGYGLALHVVGDPVRAEDVLRSAYLQLWADASGYDPARCSALAWVLATVHLQAVSRVRSGGAGSQTTRRCRSLEQVPPAQGRAIDLTYFGGLTAAEVARVSGVSERVASARICEGLAWLRDRTVEEPRTSD